MIINIEMFWSYVELWRGRNRYSWKLLAEHCQISTSKMYRLRVGKGEITVEMFNCICAGIGLNPMFVLEGSDVYGSPFLTKGE